MSRQPRSDFDSHDYFRFWGERVLDDLAQKHIVRSWLPRGEACIDVGGGFGRLTDTLLERFTVVTMVELGMRNLRAARLLVPRAQSVRGDASNLPAKSDFYDCATMVRTIHLLPDPGTALSELARAVKNGGTVIVSVPNLMMYNLSWGVKARLLTGSLRNRTPTYGSPVWPGGTAPSLTPERGFIPPELELISRRGTGWLDNYVGRMLRGSRSLYLVDVATSPLWFLKFDIFLRFRVRKLFAAALSDPSVHSEEVVAQSVPREPVLK